MILEDELCVVMRLGHSQYLKAGYQYIDHFLGNIVLIRKQEEAKPTYIRTFNVINSLKSSST